MPSTSGEELGKRVDSSSTIASPFFIWRTASNAPKEALSTSMACASKFDPLLSYDTKVIVPSKWLDD